MPTGWVILVVLTAFVLFAGKWSSPWQLSPKTWTFLILSGLATGAVHENHIR